MKERLVHLTDLDFIPDYIACKDRSISSQKITNICGLINSITCNLLLQKWIYK